MVSIRNIKSEAGQPTRVVLVVFSVADTDRSRTLNRVSCLRPNMMQVLIG